MPPPTTRQSVSIVSAATGAACSALLRRARRGAWSAAANVSTHAADICRMALLVNCWALLGVAQRVCALGFTLRIPYGCNMRHVTPHRCQRAHTYTQYGAAIQSCYWRCDTRTATSHCKQKVLGRSERSVGTATGRSRLESAGRDGCLRLKAVGLARAIAVLQKGVGLCERVIHEPSYRAPACGNDRSCRCACCTSCTT